MSFIVALMASGARKQFPKEEYRQIRKEANARFRKLTQENLSLPKAMKQHTGMNIFPTIAVYKTLVQHGMRKEEAVDVIRRFFVWICGAMFKVASWKHLISCLGILHGKI